MTEVSMKFNGSGYYDETPYKAVMQMAKPGEIWTSTMGKEFLILKNHGKFSTALRLLDHLPINATDCIQVGCLAQPRWVNPSMLMFMFNDTIGEYVEKITDAEIQDVMETVGERLGVTITVEKAESDVAPELEKLENALAEMSKKCHAYEQRIIEMERRAQPDPAAAVYKQLYHELLDKIIAGGGLK